MAGRTICVFFGLDEHFIQNPIALAKKIAASMPSIRVVRLARSYFSVVDRKDGKPVRVDQWTSRASDIFRKEYLESCGCEDYEYLYIDHGDVVL